MDHTYRLLTEDGLRDLLAQQRTQRHEQEQNSLALAHFYLETDDLTQATAAITHALSAQRPQRLSASAVLTHAVILWQRGERDQALEQLRLAQRKDRSVARADDLRFDAFWRERALQALAALLAAAAQ